MALELSLPVSGHAWLDLLIALIIAIMALYLARRPAHDFLAGAGRLLANALRLLGRSSLAAGDNLMTAYRRALINMVSEHQERLALREFEQLRRVINRELRLFPKVRDTLIQRVDRISEEYEEGPELPPPPATWEQLGTRLAELKADGDPAVESALSAVAESVQRSGQRLAADHSRAQRRKQRLLAGSRQHWQAIRDTLGRLEALLGELQSRVGDTRYRIRRLDQLSRDRSRLLRRHRSWVGLYFLAGTILAVIGIHVGMVNYHLMLLPLQQILGANVGIGAFSAAGLSALVITLLQASLALVACEALGFTRMLPLIGAQERGRRRLMAVTSLLILVLLAFTEASLAFMRDTLSLDSEWLRRELEQGTVTGPPDLRPLASLAHAGLGLVLPLSLLIFMPALEIVLQSGRVMALALFGFLAGLVGATLHFLARLATNTARLLINAYDLLVFLPLAVERSLQQRRAVGSVQKES
jgi:hypothetical protein